MTSETPIEELMNLGPTSGAWLRDVGIRTIESLRSAGSVEAFLRVKHAGYPASLNLLWALEAGLQETHFARLSEADRRTLLAELAIADPSYFPRRSR